jgi:hypothetical protein
LIFYYHDDGPLLHLGFYCGCEENTTDDGKNVEIENDVEGCDPDQRACSYRLLPTSWTKVSFGVRLLRRA